MKPKEKEYLNYEGIPDTADLITNLSSKIPLSSGTITLSDISSSYYSFPALDEELRIRDKRIDSLEEALEEAKRILRDNGIWNDSDSDYNHKIDDDDYLE